VIALDLSRLLSRAGCVTPTGIDRVELAYAQYLNGSNYAHCFAARNTIGGIGLLPATCVAQFISELASLWRDGAAPGQMSRIISGARQLQRAALFGGRALRRDLNRARTPPIYLLVLHQHLDCARSIARLKQTHGVRFVCLVHDLIPLEFPNLTRARQTRRHRRRVATVAALADAVIVNSAATSEALTARISPNVRKVPIIVAPLGVELPKPPTAELSEGPYFVCVGTIEARKNHRLLLDLWQHLAEELGHQAPLLKLIGQSGFGSERITRGVAGLRGLVVEHPDLPYVEMAAMLRAARALLMPSLAEGFGLPVLEALTLGVPVLCSDLPALRESGAGVPEYLDPADAAAWHQAILDYTSDSPRRGAQFARLAGWRPPRWAHHFAIIDQLITGFG
jgi:glycosyltransferase involved in cell wall biosynthesis